MSWAGFFGVFALFFLTHSIPVRPPVRPWLVSQLGPGGFALGYSLLSLAMLAWLIVAAGRAPYVPLWAKAPWQTYAALIFMALSCLILALAVLRANPFSFGGGTAVFDPARPGLVRWIRHPLLAALALWAIAHLLPNGDLTHVILFGTLGAFALLGGRLIDRRKRRDLGAEWERLNSAVAATSLFVKPKNLPVFLIRVVLAVVLYAGLIALHPLVIGVDPLP